MYQKLHLILMKILHIHQSWRIGSSLSTENENPSVLEQRISSKI